MFFYFFGKNLPLFYHKNDSKRVTVQDIKNLFAPEERAHQNTYVHLISAQNSF